MSKAGVSYFVRELRIAEQMGQFDIKLGELDYMKKGEERINKLKELAGEVKTSSALVDLYQIKPLADIEKMPYERARKYIMTAKSFHSTRRLIQYWHTNSTYVYSKLFPKYDIPKGQFVPGQIKNAQGEVINKQRKLFKEQFHGAMDNNKLTEQLNKILAKLKDGNYQVNISVEELAEK